MEKTIFNSVPCCYFPTEIILVDDNQAFLNNLKLELGDQVKTTAFNNPREALTYLKQKSSLGNELLEQYSEESIDYSGRSIKKGQMVNLSGLHKEIYNIDRFKIVSTVVVDFAMPQLNGREFVQALGNSSYKILMLTGEADNPIAVELFNQGLIHQFILKAQKNYLEIVAQSIEELKIKYFLNLSQTLLASLGPNLGSILSDPGYIEKYNELFKTYHIVESYLLDDSGSQLLLNAEGEIFWLFVKTEEDMQMLEDFIRDSKKAPTDVMDAIKNKKKITHFFKSQESEHPEKWQLYDAQIIRGKQDYYCANVEDIKSSSIDSKKIVSYMQYLRQSEKSQ